MKVGYVTPFYFDEITGRYARMHDLFHSLQESEILPFEFEIHSFSTNKESDVTYSDSSRVLGDADQMWSNPKNQFECILNARRVYNDLSESNCDVIHIIKLHPIAYLTSSLAADNRPIILGPNIGGWYPIREKQYKYWNEEIKPKLINHYDYYMRKILINSTAFDRVLAFSEYHKKMVTSLGVPDDRISILHPSVSQVFSPQETSISDPPEILYVGDLTKKKGYHLLLQSLAVIDKEFNLRIIGAGEPDDGLIESLDLESVVQFEGFKDRRELPEYYRSADLFVMPSIDEMGPTTILEALSCGTPVLASDQPGINEYVPEGAGITFNRDVDSLSAAIESGIENIECLNDIAQNNSSNQDMRHTTSQINNIYRSLI